MVTSQVGFGGGSSKLQKGAVNTIFFLGVLICVSNDYRYSISVPTIFQLLHKAHTPQIKISPTILKLFKPLERSLKLC